MELQGPGFRSWGKGHRLAPALRTLHTVRLRLTEIRPSKSCGHVECWGPTVLPRDPALPCPDQPSRVHGSVHKPFPTQHGAGVLSRLPKVSVTPNGPEITDLPYLGEKPQGPSMCTHGIRGGGEMRGGSEACVHSASEYASEVSVCK